MSALRQAGIPLDHMVAELTAFPVASEAALSRPVIALDPGLKAATGELWREAENELLGCFPGFSVDELVAMRDRIWFGTADSSPLHRYLRGVARGALEPQGTVAIPKIPAADQMPGPNRDAHGPMARRAWLWLGLAMPPDLLLAALGDGRGGPESVEMVTPSLDRNLRDRGFAETHLHIGAALDFPLLWNLLVHRMAHEAMAPDAFASPGAGLDEGRLLSHWLIRAVLARYLMAGFLGTANRQTGFSNYFHGELRTRLLPEMGAANFQSLAGMLFDLLRGHLEPDSMTFARLKSLYAQISRVTVVPFPDSLARARQADPLNSLLARSGGDGCSPEVCWIRAGLHYLEEREGSAAGQDLLFAGIFWQIVRIRSLFYRHVVQRPLTPGLQWFVRFFSRGRPARESIPPATLLESAAELGGRGRGLRSLEIRTSPPGSIGESLAYVEDVNRHALLWRTVSAPREGNGELELGLVYHFTKRREGGADAGKPRAHWQGSNADPHCDEQGVRTNPSGYRYARYYRQRCREATALAWLLRHRPLALHVVRGIDVCTDECGVPNWVMAPLLKRVRQGAHDGAVALRRIRQAPIPRLRTSVHAGEDFVHLLTGLRHIDEAMEQFDLQEGDRIGHGLALGIDPSDWTRRAGRIPMLREERLLDLVWEWSWYGRQAGSSDHQRQVFLDREIAVLSEAVFGQPLPPLRLELLQGNLVCERAMYEAGFPDGNPGRNPSAAISDLQRYLTDPAIFRRGREIIWVDPVREADALERLQRSLRRKVGARGLVVEVNPTSNLLIGDLGDLTSHPLWRLRPPRPGSDVPPVSVCIGSDDPVVFGSNLRHEYQFVSDALTLGGLSDEESRQWLDRTRACGLETRFTLPRSDNSSILDFFNTDQPEEIFLY